MGLKNKVAFVTGASSGIGKATALKLGKEGVKIVLSARRKEKLEEVKKTIEKEGGDAFVAPADVTKEEEIKKAVEDCIKEYGQIDFMLDIAGLGIFKLVEETSFEEWKKQIDVMLNGAFLLTRYVLPHIYKQKKGRLVYITSLWGPNRTCSKCTGYNAAKAGVSALAKSVREEIKEKGFQIGVTEIRPGTVDTEFFDKAKYKGEIDPKKALVAEEVADAIITALKGRDAKTFNLIELEGTNPPY